MGEEEAKCDVALRMEGFGVSSRRPVIGTSTNRQGGVVIGISKTVDRHGS